MNNRTKAAKATFNSMLTAVEMIIGVGFVLKFFSSDGTIAQLMDQAGDFVENLGGGHSQIGPGASIEGPAKFLMTILAFMIFGFFMITIFPNMVKKKEKEIELEDDFTI
jgi:hypothetical protein